MKLAKILKACRVGKPDRFRLADCDPDETFGLSTDKDDRDAMLADGIARLAELQQHLYAQDRWAILVVLQGIAAAIVDALGRLGLEPPKVAGARPKELKLIEKASRAEAPNKAKKK